MDFSISVHPTPSRLSLLHQRPLPSSTTKGYNQAQRYTRVLARDSCFDQKLRSVIYKYFLKCPPTCRLLTTRLTRTIEIGPRATLLTSPSQQTASLLAARGTKGLRNSTAPVLWMRGECSIRVKIEPWLKFWTPSTFPRSCHWHRACHPGPNRHRLLDHHQLSPSRCREKKGDWPGTRARQSRQ
jgi:hypothetical protein